MYRLSKRGLNAVDLFGQQCVPNIDDPSCPAPSWWMKLWGLTDPTVGVAPAPTGAVLTTPPASGADAQATVDALVNQQLVNQQAANAAGVTSSWVDTAASSAVAAGGVLTSGFPWLLAGLGIFALIALGGVGPKRYGR